jgi:hypothetical protein
MQQANDFKSRAAHWGVANFARGQGGTAFAPIHGRWWLPPRRFIFASIEYDAMMVIASIGRRIAENTRLIRKVERYA